MSENVLGVFFPSKFSTKVCVHFSSDAPLILLDLITLIMFGEELKLCSSSLLWVKVKVSKLVPVLN
jgi:hypothetical protein